MSSDFLYTVTHDLGAIGGMFGGLVALFWLGRRLVRLDQAIDQLSKVTNAELTHNGGHSTKDYAARAYKKTRKVEQKLSALEQKVDAHLKVHETTTTSTSTETVTTGPAHQQPVGFRGSSRFHE